MLQKVRLFLVTLVASTLLLACSNETIENPTSEETAEESSEVLSDTKTVTTEETDEITSTTQETDMTGTEDNTESKGETEAGNVTSEKDNSSDQEVMNFTYQNAVDQFIAITGLNIEDYTFSFEETDAFIEITVYEKTEDEQAHTPLAGKYRYIIDTAEILVQDYLTGAFVPFEDTE